MKNSIKSESISLPVNDSTHVDLQVAVGAQLLSLHRDQVHGLAVQTEETHAALEEAEWVSALLPVVLSGAPCERWERESVSELGAHTLGHIIK